MWLLVRRQRRPASLWYGTLAKSVRSSHRQGVDANVRDDQEIAALLAAADSLRPRLLAVTCRTLFGLLAVTGST